MSEEKEKKEIVICIVGDAPNLPTGLARIARDLTRLLFTNREELGIRVCQLGYGYDGSPWPWAVFPMINEKEWGSGSVELVIKWLGEVPIFFTIWDAGRCFGLLQSGDMATAAVDLEDWPELQGNLWGYFPIDGNNPQGKVGGPGAETLKLYSRVLAYSGYGSGILRATRGDEKVQWLPHGIDSELFDYEKVDEFVDLGAAGVQNMEWLFPLRDASEAGVLLGGVATNQPRKDLALFFATAAAIRSTTWPKLQLWLHSDMEVTEAWSIPELAQLYGFNNSSFTLTTHNANDIELACAYALCYCTLAVGAGEGFGYPIVESLACGTPVIHGAYGGGAELIPRAEWLVDSIAMHVSGPTALLRPVYNPLDFAQAAADAIKWRVLEPAVVRAFCRGSVANLGWRQLASRWLSWFRRGLEEQRRAGREGLADGGN